MTFWEKISKTNYRNKMGPLTLTKDVDGDDFPSSRVVVEWQSPVTSPVEKECAKFRSKSETYPWVGFYTYDGREHVSVTVVGIDTKDGMSKLGKAVHRFLEEAGESDTEFTRLRRVLVKDRASGKVDETI